MRKGKGKGERYRIEIEYCIGYGFQKNEVSV